MDQGDKTVQITPMPNIPLLSIMQLIINNDDFYENL